MKKPQQEPMLPRLLRPAQAYVYLSMSRTAFDANVRPYVKEIRIGARGVAFDRLELDRWTEGKEDYESGPSKVIVRGKKCQRKAVSRASSKEAMFGISISKSQDMAAFAAALEQATGRKPKGI